MIVVIVSTTLSLVFLWIFSQVNGLDRLCSAIVNRSKRYRRRRRPKRLILVRHGESQGNRDSSIYATVPDHAIELTDKGRKQARHCGEELREIIGMKEKLICFVSPFRRSRETCQLICEAFPKENILKVQEDPRIREQEWYTY